ncbi:hypothetical protein V8B97DRAFT_2103950 [Scleroderma yunnanense]
MSRLPAGFTSNALCSIQKVYQGLSLVHTPHEFWPYRPGLAHHLNPAIRISILDSSFNPPTLAHLALINSRPSDGPSDQATASDTDYDARLLLLSVSNPDKTLKPADASYIQRLQMMYLLSLNVSANHSPSSPSESHLSSNTAIAVINASTFVSKSAVLLPFLRTRLASLRRPLITATNDIPTIPHPKLIFLMGYDTLVRVFSARYYASEHEAMRLLRNFLSPGAEDCRVVCAHRTSPPNTRTFEDATENNMLDITKEFIRGERIYLIDIGEDEQTFSSSEVRTKIVAGNNDWRHLVTNFVADYLVENQLYVSDTQSM